MEQRDIIKDQTEQLGKVLGKILSDFLGLKSAGNTIQGIEISNERFKSELDIDIEKLLTFNKSELKTYLITHKLTAAHLETLSEYLTEIAKIQIDSNRADAKIKLKKAVEILNIADEISNILSLDRINKQNKINNMLHRGIS